MTLAELLHDIELGQTTPEHAGEVRLMADGLKLIASVPIRGEENYRELDHFDAQGFIRIARRSLLDNNQA